MPAHPHALSFAFFVCGAVSVPRTNIGWPDVAASTKAIRKAWGKDIAVVPSQSSGASDSMYYRRLGIPAYGASPLFTKDSEEFSHGRNERVRLENIRPGITYYLSLLTDLTK